MVRYRRVLLLNRSSTFLWFLGNRLREAIQNTWAAWICRRSDDTDYGCFPTIGIASILPSGTFGRG